MVIISNQPMAEILDVWDSNLDDAMRQMAKLVKEYPYVAMDTEFPGVVARPIGEFSSQADYQYQLTRANVDLLKMIQIGFSFFNEKGESPPGAHTYQLNFKFNLTDEMYHQDSIELLTSSGIQFPRFYEEGVDHLLFAEKLYGSGLIMNPNVTFISFSSHYDFGYLIKLLSPDEFMPHTEEQFFDFVKILFPRVYDVKAIMKYCKNMHGGLQDTADVLKIERQGPQHQAGSDARITGQVFFKISQVYFDGNLDENKHLGIISGLGNAHADPQFRGRTPPINTSNSQPDLTIEP